MKRSSPIKRTPLQPSRQRIKPVSDKRREANKARASAMLERFGPREEWRCQFSSYLRSSGCAITPSALACFGPVNGHEIVSRAQAGRTDANLLDMDGIVLLCNGHNDACEDFPDMARALGLKKRLGET